MFGFCIFVQQQIGGQLEIRFKCIPRHQRGSISRSSDRQGHLKVKFMIFLIKAYSNRSSNLQTIQLAVKTYNGTTYLQRPRIL